MAGPKFDAEGLRDEWDKIEGIRLRLRRGKPLLAGTMSEYTISRCVENTEVLTPVLLRSVACDHKRPEVELLREEIENLLMMNQREFSESHIDDMAWEVRKLLTFVKRKAQRQEVSLASQLNSVFLYVYNETGFTSFNSWTLISLHIPGS